MLEPVVRSGEDGPTLVPNDLLMMKKPNPQQTIQDLNQGTVDTLSRLPVTGFATGHAQCPRADNGAPDCRVASDQLCQARGYKSGRGLDVETAENCNPRIFLPGYQRKEGDCLLGAREPVDLGVEVEA